MKFVIFQDEKTLKLATAEEWSSLQERYKFKGADPRYIDIDLSLFNALQTSSASGQIQTFLRELYNGN